MAETDKDDLISIIEEDDSFEDIPATLPLLPVRDIVIFSDMLLPLFIGREKSVHAVEESVNKDRFLIVATQTDSGSRRPDQQACQGRRCFLKSCPHHPSIRRAKPRSSLNARGHSA